ncbi:hypothetical protein RB200_11990 [Streptomyces sp. PmtG]
MGVAHAGVDGMSESGSISIGDVARGEVSLQASTGDLEVGIRPSSTAWLDVESQTGAVRNALGATAGPAEDAETVKVRAHTGVGNIVIRRAAAPTDT